MQHLDAPVTVRYSLTAGDAVHATFLQRYPTRGGRLVVLLFAVFLVSFVPTILDFMERGAVRLGVLMLGVIAFPFVATVWPLWHAHRAHARTAGAYPAERVFSLGGIRASDAWARAECAWDAVDGAREADGYLLVQYVHGGIDPVPLRDLAPVDADRLRALVRDRLGARARV